MVWHSVFDLWSDASPSEQFLSSDQLDGLFHTLQPQALFSHVLYVLQPHELSAHVLYVLQVQLSFTHDLYVLQVQLLFTQDLYVLQVQLSFTQEQVYVFHSTHFSYVQLPPTLYVPGFILVQVAVHVDAVQSYETVAEPLSHLQVPV